MILTRPQPPEELRAPGFQIATAEDVTAWARAMFIDESSPFENPDHAHLRLVDLVFMWTNVEWENELMPVAGYAEIVNVTGKPWAKAERTDHLCLMHGNVPQARVWLYAPYWAAASDSEACALVDHEFYHYAHKKSREGELMFDDEGRPQLVKRAHDVEEFIGVGRRWGLGALHPNVRLLIKAVQEAPLFDAAAVASVCGSCR